MYDLGFIKISAGCSVVCRRLRSVWFYVVLRHLSYRVRGLAFEQMNNAEYVEVERSKTGHRIERAFYPSNEENAFTQTLIEKKSGGSRHYFRSTKHRCEDITGHWRQMAIMLVCFDGSVAQAPADSG